MSAETQIVPLEQAPLDGVLALLDATLGPGHDEAWFEWKHRRSPFGPSPGWAAVDARGVAAVRLLLRWRLGACGQTLGALRPVDTATAPRARRRGLFRELTETALRAAEDDGSSQLIFNNPNRLSRPGYLAMGWSELGTVRHGWTPALALGRGGAEIALGESALGGFEHQPPPESLSTERTPAYLAWRYSPPFEAGYRIAALQSTERPNALVYRVAERRVRVLVVLELLAEGRDRRRLLAAAARREGAPVVLAAIGTGSAGHLPAPWLRRGGSRLVARPLSDAGVDVGSLGSWALGLGDLEGVL